jgi:hypothetical protein
MQDQHATMNPPQRPNVPTSSSSASSTSAAAISQQLASQVASIEITLVVAYRCCVRLSVFGVRLFPIR